MQIIECDGVRLKVDADGDVFITLTDAVSASILVGRAERGAFVHAVAKLGLALPASETLQVTLEGPRFEDAALIAPPTDADVRLVSDYAAALAHPERTDAERAVGMLVGRLVAELSRRQRAALIWSARADAVLCGGERPAPERAVLARAIEPVIRATNALPDRGDLPDAAALDDLTACALAYMIAATDICASLDRAKNLAAAPVQTRCGYCFDAATTDEQRAAVPFLPWADSREHVAHCEHNPLVRRLLEMEAELAASERDRRTLVDRLHAQTTSEKLTDAEAGNAQAFAARLSEAGRALLDNYVGVSASTSWRKAWEEMTLLLGRSCEPYTSAPELDKVAREAHRAGISTGHSQNGLDEDGYAELFRAWWAFYRSRPTDQRGSDPRAGRINALVCALAFHFADAWGAEQEEAGERFVELCELLDLQPHGHAVALADARFDPREDCAEHPHGDASPSDGGDNAAIVVDAETKPAEDPPGALWHDAQPNVVAGGTLPAGFLGAAIPLVFGAPWSQQPTDVVAVRRSSVRARVEAGFRKLGLAPADNVVVAIADAIVAEL